MTMIYVNFGELESPMPNIEIQDHRVSGSGILKVFTLHGPDGLLGHLYITRTPRRSIAHLHLVK